MNRIVALLLAIAASLCPADAAEPARPDDALVGLWGSESTFGPAIRGELTLERIEDRWIARVAGLEASTTSSDDRAYLVFPGGLGALRVEGSKRDARGFWIQPAGNIPSYAVPITLVRAGPHTWRGDVEPLDDRFSIYLLIEREESGELRGLFRNPEMNWTGRLPSFRVTLAEESIELADPATGQVKFVQPYEAGQSRISMDFGALIALTLRDRDNAVGFYPRTPALERYVYREPSPRDDGWKVAKASRVGMDETKLEALIQRIVDTDPSAPDTPLIHSVLIARKGQLVLEEYFSGYGPDRLHDLRSASKTVTSIMAGIAIDRGELSLDAPVEPLFREPGAADRMSVAHLLTHTSGFACDDDDGDSPGNEDVMQHQSDESDWYRYFLALDRLHEPGVTYAYCSAGINLVGGAVARATATPLPEFFDRYVARPLDIRRYAMNLMPTGEAYAGGGLHLLPRDFLKLGPLFLDGGTWNGRRVVSRRWVDQSTAHRIAIPGGGSDGYGWHRHTLRAAGRTFEEYEASGNGGQFLIVIPELDLTVVFTAGSYGQYGAWRRLRDELVPQFILPACGL